MFPTVRIVLTILAGMGLLSGCGNSSRPAADAPVAGVADPELAAQLAKFREVYMPYDKSGLSDRQQKLVGRLAEATRLLDDLFWAQSDPEGLKLYRSLASSVQPRDQQLRRLLRVNGGRYNLIEENKPFAGAGPRPPGANIFPVDLTRAELDAYVEKHPEQKAALFDPYAVVRRKGDLLTTIPYHVAYRQWLNPIVAALREAASYSDDPAFTRFLNLRADSLLTDDYYQSDLAWVDLVNPQFDVIFAPYETYLDGLLGVKASYGAAVLIRNETESRKLEIFQKYLPDIQDSLPLNKLDRPSKKGHATPMEVMETPIRGGDLRHGYQAVADNLPNDPRVHEAKGTKKIFFRNYMDARVNNVIQPLANALLIDEQAKLATAEGYMSFVLMHEVSHGLGPAFSRTMSGKQDIRAAIGAAFSGLEEAKADIASLYAIKWLVDHGNYPREKLNEVYGARIADMLREVRFGVAEAHGRGAIMQFNFLTERGAISFDAASGRYALNFAVLPEAVAALAKELLEQEATGDRSRTEAWFVKYGSVSPELSKALVRANDVPVDVDPVSELPEL